MCCARSHGVDGQLDVPRPSGQIQNIARNCTAEDRPQWILNLVKLHHLDEPVTYYGNYSIRRGAYSAEYKNPVVRMYSIQPDLER